MHFEKTHLILLLLSCYLRHLLNKLFYLQSHVRNIHCNVLDKYLLVEWFQFLSFGIFYQVKFDSINDQMPLKFNKKQTINLVR